MRKATRIYVLPPHVLKGNELWPNLGSELPTAAKPKVPQGKAQNTERNIPFRNRKYIVDLPRGIRALSNLGRVASLTSSDGLSYSTVSLQ